MQTPIHDPRTFAALGAPTLVYVREVAARDVLADASIEFDGGPDAVPADALDPDAIWYAVHAADGSRLAVLDDRDAAFEAARLHALQPVSVH